MRDASAGGSSPVPPVPPVELGPIHHVAIVVADLDAGLAVYRDTFGLEVTARHDLREDGVRAAFLGGGPARLELMEPVRPDTGVARFLESRGSGLHHVCFEVADLAAAMRALSAEGVELIDAAPRRGALGPVVFLHPRSAMGVLLELIERRGGPAWRALGLEPGQG
jgi:methylmalonyl-CoA/ethylmalonyl-CoA epimerase